MDISRLPVISHGYGLPAPSRGDAARDRSVEPVNEVARNRRPRDPVEQVIQGEVLERSRGERRYSPTSDYLRSRLYEGEYAADEQSGSRKGTSAYAGQHAVGAYMAHTRDLIQPDVNRGTSVDYFI